MDSMTQAVLGAAVADVGLGRKIGRKAAWWGAAVGTLPDLDILFYPVLDQVQRLGWHRGASHGLLLMTVCAPAIAWMWRKLHGTDAISWRRGIITAWLIWSTHVAIDCATVYGTGVWSPFSERRVAWDLLFIVDPLYTTPLLIAAVAGMIWRMEGRRWRHRLTIAGLVLSTAYIGWAAAAKQIITARFERSLAEAGVEPARLRTGPTVANTILWRGIAEAQREGERGYYIGYASLLDDDERVRWRWVPRRAELLGELAGSRAAASVMWFSEGWYAVRAREGRVYVSDLRFGEVSAARPDIEGVERPWIFNWRLDEDGASHERLGPTLERAAALEAVWRRIGGRRFPIAEAEAGAPRPKTRRVSG